MANGSCRSGGRRNRDMVRLTVYLPRPVVSWLDGRAAGSGLTRSDELRLALASLAASSGPADGVGAAIGAGVGGGSSSALGAGAAGSEAGSPVGVAEPEPEPPISARHVGGVPAATAVRTERRTTAGPAVVREFTPAAGRPDVCGRADSGMSKFRHAAGRWCP